MVYRAKHISSGHYLYRGYKIARLGYYEPEHHVVWEAEDENGCGFAHSFFFTRYKRLIDEHLDKEETK